MIELRMVRRMIRRGLLFAAPVIALLGLVGGAPYMVAAAAGVALTLANLWIAGRIIGGMAENRPELLMAGGIAALVFGLGTTLAGLVVASRIDYIDMMVLGLVLLGTHFGVVVWEAADAFLKIDPAKSETASHQKDARVRTDEELMHGA